MLNAQDAQHYLPFSVMHKLLFNVKGNFIFIKRCNTILCKPTGGKAKLTIGSSFRVKA